MGGRLGNWYGIRNEYGRWEREGGKRQGKGKGHGEDKRKGEGGGEVGKKG